MDFCYTKIHPEVLERDPTMILLGPFNISGCIFPLVMLSDQKTCSRSKHANMEEKCFFAICSRMLRKIICDTVAENYMHSGDKKQIKNL